MVKFLIIGDLHGAIPKMHFKDFDAIIAPGDFCSDKNIRPLYKEFFRLLKSDKELKWWEFISDKCGKKKYGQYIKESLERGRQVLIHLNSFNKPVFIVPGNWDQSKNETKIKDPEKDYYSHERWFLDLFLTGSTNNILKKGLKNIRDCHYQVHKFKGISIFGYGNSSGKEKITENKLKDKHKINVLDNICSKIFAKIDMTYANHDRNQPTIFLSHNIPYNTKLDVVNNKKSHLHNKHFGSLASRYFCMKYSPLVCIGGHIHEHFGKCKLGKTTVINAGYGGKVNTLLEIENSRIKSIKFYKAIQ